MLFSLDAEFFMILRAKNRDIDKIIRHYKTFSSFKKRIYIIFRYFM
jgi:hypothetical protein